MFFFFLNSFVLKQKMYKFFSFELFSLESIWNVYVYIEKISHIPVYNIHKNQYKTHTSTHIHTFSRLTQTISKSFTLKHKYIKMYVIFVSKSLNNTRYDIRISSKKRAFFFFLSFCYVLTCIIRFNICRWCFIYSFFPLKVILLPVLYGS